MRPLRVRLTVRRLMALIAVIAVALGGFHQYRRWSAPRYRIVQVFQKDGRVGYYTFDLDDPGTYALSFRGPMRIDDEHVSRDEGGFNWLIAYLKARKYDFRVICHCRRGEG